MSDSTRRRTEGAASRLLDWYDRNRRDLPWRRDPTSYRVWIAEVMLQQTRVETVLPYYLRFLERFPDFQSLARGTEDQVLSLWSGLGYYRRARSLHAAARKIVREHGGHFPRDLDKALALPGVGRYTAGAVLSIAYNLPVPVLDGNVERVLTRVHALRGDPRRGLLRKRLWREAEALLTEERAGDLNQALMELGALVCLPAPRCDDCPWSPICKARVEGQLQRYPEKRGPRKSVPVHLGALVLRRDSRVLVMRHAPGGTDDARASGVASCLEGLWNPPIVEIRDPRHVTASLHGHLRQRWGGSFDIEGTLGTVRHGITFRRIIVHAMLARVTRLPRRSRSGNACGDTEWKWARRRELGTTLPVSSLALKILALLEEQ